MHGLIELLGDKDPNRRRAAYRLLEREGDAILPLLMAARADSLTAHRALRDLTRKARKLRLSLRAPAQHAIGTPLTLTLSILNDTEFTMTLPFQEQRNGRQRSCMSVFFDRKEFRLLPNHVRGFGPHMKIAPQQTIEFQAVIGPEARVLTKPGALKVSWKFLARRVVIAERAPDRGYMRVLAEPVPLLVQGRTPAQLGKALDGGAAERQAALVEVRTRTDDAMRPLLRKRFRDPDLALTAIQVLAGAAEEQDLKLFMDTSTNHPDARVRVAAVRALGGYQARKARQRLLRLVLDHDEELLDAAADALSHHKNARTVGVYISLLRKPGPWQHKIARRLTRWTGKAVSLRDEEIDAFEQWFLRERKAGRPWALSDRPRK